MQKHTTPQSLVPDEGKCTGNESYEAIAHFKDGVFLSWSRNVVWCVLFCLSKLRFLSVKLLLQDSVLFDLNVSYDSGEGCVCRESYTPQLLLLVFCDLH